LAGRLLLGYLISNLVAVAVEELAGILALEEMVVLEPLILALALRVQRELAAQAVVVVAGLGMGYRLHGVAL
jgi:hypothetical protein